MCPSGPFCNWEWHIESHYPTQAKERLEWGTQRLLPVWQNPVQFLWGPGATLVVWKMGSRIVWIGRSAGLKLFRLRI
jgi:hypothetical protein